MANEEYLRMLKKGVEAWNQWRIKNPIIYGQLDDGDLGRGRLNLIGADLRCEHLSGANLCGTNLREVNLMEAQLSGAGFGGSDLSEADLRAADLRDADLSRTELKGADLSMANLSGADLRETELIGANFSGAHLDGTILSQARVNHTNFGDVDLSRVKGLETIKHEGPCTIGIDTIYRSQGKIPEVFLRGAGVPDNFIEYMHSLVGTAFEFYSCFISYSGHDQEFADRIYEGLQNNGVRCWFAPHHIQAGKKLHEQIDDAIRFHERLLLILSPNSIKSEWVKAEIAKARKRELREGRRVLFPISLNILYQQLQDWECFDADAGKDSAREIREYYIPDFSSWKDHDSFQREFQKLLRDLKKPDAARAMVGE